MSFEQRGVNNNDNYVKSNTESPRENLKGNSSELSAVAMKVSMKKTTSASPIHNEQRQKIINRRLAQ